MRTLATPSAATGMQEAQGGASAIQKTVLVVAAALIDGQGRVLLAQRPPGKALEGLWEFPGGKVGCPPARPPARPPRVAHQPRWPAAGGVELVAR